MSEVKHNFGSPFISSLCFATSDFTVATTRGTLVQGFSIESFSASTWDQNQFNVFSVLLRNILLVIPDVYDIAVINATSINGSYKPAETDSDTARAIINRRGRYLNEKGVRQHHLWIFVELNPSSYSDAGAMLYQSNLKGLVNVAQTLNVKELVKWLKYSLSPTRALHFSEELLSRNTDYCLDQIAAFTSRLGVLFEANALDVNQIFSVARFLTSYDIDSLNEPFEAPGWGEQWQNHLLRGDIKYVVASNMPLMLFRGSNDIYVRFGSVKGVITQYEGGALSGSLTSPVLGASNLVMVNRFLPFSPFQRMAFFQSRRNEIKRMNINVMDMISGRKEVNQTLGLDLSEEKFNELASASELDERFGDFTTHFALFSRDPAELRRESVSTQSSFEAAGFNIIWESDGMRRTFLSMQLNRPDTSIRVKTYNTQQVACLLPVFQPSKGSDFSKDINQPHVFPFVNSRRDVYLFNLWSGGSGLNFGCGPSRTGKSFTKNAIAAHFQQYKNCFYTAIDVDAGTEPIAHVFNGISKIVKVNPLEGQGFNPFASLTASTADAHKVFVKNLIVQMVRLNESEDGKQFSSSEEKTLESVISDVIDVADSETLTFQHFHAQLPHELRRKLSSYVDDGVFAQLFRSAETVDNYRYESRLTVYNLQSLKGSEVMRRLALAVVFFRNRLMFTDHRLRKFPKLLDIDEGKDFFSNPGAMEEISSNALQFGKFNTGMTIWTQSPEHYKDIGDFKTILASANSLILLPDANADFSVYNAVFGLTSGEVETLRSLQPRKELLLIQRGLGISEPVMVDPDPYLYAIGTSSALEQPVRDDLIEEHGVGKGLELFIQYLIDNERLPNAA